jgi:sigma-E factor negative regulatory protein RseA
MNADKMEAMGGGMLESGTAEDCAQRLSCLLDGELDDHGCGAIFEQLRRDEALCNRWATLNCVGDALRSAEVAAWHSEGFVARVAAALEKEPTVLAPAARPDRAGLRRWLLPGAGAAAAAAVLIVIGLPSQRAGAPEAMANRGKAATTPVVAAVSPAPVQIDRSPLLEHYLAAHRELAEPALMPQSTPYVRTSGSLHSQEAR